ncbi:hypothetical protein CJ030_MR6G009124, partial [Morella rubra]
DVVQESLLKLLTARYIERCPAPEPVLAAPVKEETTAKKRGPKSAKTNEESETIGQRVLAAAAPMEAQRFLFVTNAEAAVRGEKRMDDSPNVRVGEKRKYDASELDGESSVEEDEVVLWRANFEEFIRRLRHKACIENVRERLDDGAAIVLRAVLEATRIPLSLNHIFEEVMKSKEGRDLKTIIELVQNDEVESIVLKRYGRDAYRIFRLLSKNGHLVETDKISDTTFVEKKDAPKILYKLWKDEYLHMEKLVVAGARQSQFLLWKVKKPTLWEHVLDEMFHAALNLSQRVAYELEKEKENETVNTKDKSPRLNIVVHLFLTKKGLCILILLILVVLPSLNNLITVYVQFINLHVDKQVMSREERLNRLRSVRILLESSLLKLDDALMLFHDFRESSLLKLDDALLLSHD